MTGPKPLTKIEGDCSTIHSNTLYIYSPTGFASIPLKKDGAWKKLPTPQHMVTGPACVQGGADGDEAFYLVGGTGSDGNSGLQRFSFSTQEWETLPMRSADMQNRTGHGAGYIPSTSQILVYAGNTDGSTQISQSTLLISTKSPFDIESGVPQGEPALYEPIILPWSSSEVALIGGSATNTAIFIYQTANKQGWNISEATLPSAIQSKSLCALASDSGTRVLEEFNMVASPNSVTSYLLTSKGKVQNPVTAIASLEKRGLTDSYNNTFAPTESWSDYTLAQGDGLVVLASGQSNNSVAIFNQTSNAWVNSTELFFGKGDQHVLKPSTTSFTSSTSTSTSSSTSTSMSTAASTTPTSSSPVAAAASGLTDHGKMILGATLGSILGFGLILLIILFLLRRAKKKKKQQAVQLGRDGDGKDRLSFQDQGIEPLTAGAYPMARSPVPLAATSTDSLAIMSGTYREKSLKPPVNTGYGLSQPKTSSPLSTIPSSGAMGASSVYTDDTDRHGDDTERGNQAADRMTDEGWGKYFEGGGATNFQSDRSTVSSAYTKSDYRGSGWPMTTLTPLNFGFLDEPKPLGHVLSGSPTTENGPSEVGSRSLVIPESQSARISSADSISIASDDDRDDSKWQGAGQSSWLGRPPSSNYTASFYQPNTQDTPWEPSNGNLADQGRQSNARRSSFIIPHDIDELPVQEQQHNKNNTNSDMSWLNLKADR